MSERFYIPGPIEWEAGLKLELPAGEGSHLLKILRAKPGDRLVVFDGSGREFQSEVVSAQAQLATVKLLAVEEVERELQCRTHVYSAVPKGKAADMLVRQLCELGAASWSPLLCKRSVVTPGAAKPERWRQAVIEASKQCGRNRLMEVRSALPFLPALEEAKNVHACLLHTDNLLPSFLDAMQMWKRNRVQEVAVFIGPEGGFTEEEIASARAQSVECVCYGASVLRIATAAAAALAAIKVVME